MEHLNQKSVSVQQGEIQTLQYTGDYRDAPQT